MIAVYIYGMLLFDKNDKLKPVYKIIFFLVICIIHTFIFLHFDGTTKTILLCIIYGVILNNFFDIDIIKAVFASIIYMILLIIPELITLGVVTKIFNMSKEYCYDTFAGSIIGNCCISVLTIILTSIIKRPLKKIINYDFSTNKKIVLVSLLVLISLAIFFYSLINTFEFSNNVIGYLIVIITLILILFYLFKQKIENEAISKKYDDLLNVMKTYESDIEEQRAKIHETRNELMTIKCKINDKAKEIEIIEYIDSILGDKTSSNMSKYSKFKYLPSNGIKGFFYYKFMEAEKRNIKVSVNISKKIENSFIGSLDTKNFKDLVRIIGVYLDNAIEASSESDDKKLGIEIYLIQDDIEIIISNTFNNDINMDKIGKEKFTTKGKNHGHGLLLVKHILHNNSIFKVKNEIINNLYVQTLKIKNSK